MNTKNQSLTFNYTVMKLFILPNVSVGFYLSKMRNKLFGKRTEICEENSPEPDDPFEKELSPIGKDMFTKKQVSYLLEGLKAINSKKRKVYKEMKETGIDKKYLRALGKDIYNIQLLIDRIKETCLSNSEQ